MKLTIQKPFHTTSYSITTNSRHLYEWLEIAYGEYATNVAQATHNIHIDVLNGFQSKVCVDGLELTVRDPVDYLNKYIYETSIMIPDYFLFHASAVQKNDKAYVFLSPTSRGKSTLTCYLVNNSFTFISDDVVAINKSDLQIQRINNNIHLRPNGYNAIKDVLKNNRVLHCSYFCFDRYVFYPFFPSNYDKINCVEFFYTKFSPVNRITYLDTNDRNTVLYKSALYPYNIDLKAFEFITKIQQNFHKMIEYNCFDFLVNNI